MYKISSQLYPDIVCLNNWDNVDILAVRNLGGYLRIPPPTLAMEDISLFKYLFLPVMLLRSLKIQELSFTISILGKNYLYKTGAEKSCLFLATWLSFK